MADYVTNPCTECGAATTVLASQYRHGRGRTCSRACSQAKAQKAKWANSYAGERRRFWDRVDRSAGVDGCWPWLGATFPSGYGRFRRHRKTILTHRYSLTDAIGPASDPSLLALHSCDNPICCNPAHLRWGTPQDNVDDCISRGRKKAPPRVIDDRVVRELRAQGQSNTEIARHFGVHPTSISRALLRALEARAG